MAKIGYDPKGLTTVASRLNELADRVTKLATEMSKEKIPSVKFDNEGFKNRGFDDLERWLDRAEADYEAELKAKHRKDRAEKSKAASPK